MVLYHPRQFLHTIVLISSQVNPTEETSADLLSSSLCNTHTVTLTCDFTALSNLVSQHYFLSSARPMELPPPYITSWKFSQSRKLGQSRESFVSKLLKNYCPSLPDTDDLNPVILLPSPLFLIISSRGVNFIFYPWSLFELVFVKHQIFIMLS